MKNQPPIFYRATYWQQRANITNASAQYRGALDKITGEELRRKFLDQDGLCYWCQLEMMLGGSRHRKGTRKGIAATVDHVVRIRDGGKNTIDNIVWACSSCNSTRHQRKEVSNNEEDSYRF